MHNPTLNGHSESGHNMRGKTSGSRKCNCCPYGYHLDLDFVRYCEKVANSQLLQSARNTIPRVRAGRKKRESIESLLGIVPPQAQTAQVKIDTWRSDREEKTDKAFSDALEKAVSDFEKMFNSSSRPRSADEHQIERVGNDNKFNLKLRSLGELKEKTEDIPFEDTKIFMNGTNNEIRNQMSASLNRMRQLEEEVKHIPNLQNQVKKLRWENRRLTKLLESKNEASDKYLKEQIKANEVKQDIVRHSRTIGTGCTVLKRDVAVSNQVLLTTTGTDPIPPERVEMPRLIHRYTNTDFPRLRLSEEIPKESKPSARKTSTSHSASQTTTWPIKPITLQCGIQTDTRPLRVPTADFSAQHDSPPRAVPTTSNTGRPINASLRNVSNSDVGIQLEKIPTLCASTQFETRPDLIPPSKDVSTQVVQDRRPAKQKDFGLQVKPLMTDAGMLAKFHSVENATQTLRIHRKDIGINVNKGVKTTTTAVNTEPEPKVQLAPKATLFSRYSDTHDLCKKKDASVEAKTNLVNASVDTHGLKEYKKDRQERDPKVIMKESNITGEKKTLFKAHTLQQLQKNEEVPSQKGMQENISPVASVISKPYEKKEPSKEMKGAMKVLNDSLLKSPSGEMPKSMRNAVNIIQQEWFKISSTADANPLDVEDYLDCFEELSVGLLEYVVNMTDVSGNTAMHYAVSNGNFDVVSILLDSKVCNINKLNTAGYTCIMLVALTKVKSETDRQVVRRLFHMADVNIRAKQHGQTALMLAVSHGRIDTVELLLESGADINIQDEDGSTALMCAAEHGYIDIVKLLLAQPDCDLAITDLDGNTALNIAMEAGNRDIGVLLYAQEHFSRGNSPFSTLKSRRAKSSTPTLKTRTPTPPNCSQEHSL